MKNATKILACTSVSLLTLGCASTRPSAVTPGAAKMYLKPGVTHQVDVIEKFGTPNVVTRRDGGEMWVYDKVSSHNTSGIVGLGGIGGGAGSGGLGGGGIFGGLGSQTGSETTVMLIVYFDPNDVVVDYRITQTKF